MRLSVRRLENVFYKLTQLALKDGDIQEAEAYYREFCSLAEDDSRQYILRYLILKAKNAPPEQLVNTLEAYTSMELDEKWLYELADLYHRAGDANRCVAACDKIMLMFGLGKYVDKAMELKVQYAPLNNYQMDLVENRDVYEEKLKAVEQGNYRVEDPYMEERRKRKNRIRDIIRSLLMNRKRLFMSRKNIRSSLIMRKRTITENRPMQKLPQQQKTIVPITRQPLFTGMMLR